MRLINRFSYKKILSLFRHQQGSPIFKAKGIAVGVFSGCFPFFGLQTFLGILLAQIIRGNLILAAIGTWISNPFTYLPLYFFNYKVGSFLLQDKEKIIPLQAVDSRIWNQGWYFIKRIIIGSSFVGLILGLILGLFTYYLYSHKSKKNNF